MGDLKPAPVLWHEDSGRKPWENGRYSMILYLLIDAQMFRLKLFDIPFSCPSRMPLFFPKWTYRVHRVILKGVNEPVTVEI